jgi:Flp pilus assembly protein TadD
MELLSLKPGTQVGVKTQAKANHRRGLQLYAGGQYQQAAALLQEVFRPEATSEIANDCAAADLAGGQKEKALACFLLAVPLDAEHAEAAANLGVLMASPGRVREAIPYLQKAALRVNESQRAALVNLLAKCGNQVADDTLRESRAAAYRAVAQRKMPPCGGRWSA